MTWPRRCQFPPSHHVVGREFLEFVHLTTSRNFLVVCCHVPLNVCAEVLERSVGSGIGSKNTASFTNTIAPHAARTSPLLSNLRISQSEQLNPATGPTQRHLAGNCCWVIRSWSRCTVDKSMRSITERGRRSGPCRPKHSTNRRSHRSHRLSRIRGAQSRQSRQRTLGLRRVVPSLGRCVRESPRHSGTPNRLRS